MSNDTCPERPTGVIGVATSGIQDVSALLPLLGTEQCERHTTLALEKGLLYAAATPMSIFGSLGLVKAGFVVFWSSIDTRWFHGPTLLHDAGFTPAGLGALLTCRSKNERDLYTAEDKLQRILAKKRIHSVQVDHFSWESDLVLWNIRLIFATALLSSFGLLPYVFLITQTLSTRPFQTTWLYPIIRIVGCGTIAITIQIVLQLRLLDEAYSRIRFMAIDRYMKDKRIHIPAFWNSNHRSKNALKRLSTDSSLEEEGVKRGLGVWSPFEIPPDAGRILERKLTLDPGQAEMGPKLESGSPAPTHLLNPTFLLWVCQAFLLIGLGLTIVGYIGCFSVVQSSPRTDSQGPLIWLVCEALLAVLRTVLWASNPSWDDAKSPIVSEKIAAGGKNGGNGDSNSSYAINWMLDSVTADDMHAVIIGIDEFGSDSFPDLKSCVSDAKSVKSYLEATLLVPRDQVITLLNENATKERIIKELEALSQKASVAQDAPIIIYFATHSFMRATSKEITTYLVPHGAVTKPDPYLQQEAVQGAYIQYDTIRDILHDIADEKTENITLILDTCHAGSLGSRYRSHSDARMPSKMPPHHIQLKPEVNIAELEKLGITTRGDGSIAPHDVDVFHEDSSPVVLAGTSAWGQAFELPHSGGLFTKCLLGTLTDKKQNFKEMKYKTLMDETNRKMREEWEEFKKSSEWATLRCLADPERFCQKAEYTSNYENQLVFNGLLARRITDNDLKPFLKVKYSDL
ncbi:hypothetical protein EST38_g13041 [Candolleomyces aberdarensis]|uniref:Peptidase C14 caspase domain-containing protein n=1 Tax=Candolleomyces aberdarensis TaxID=2316362 RepID=A0A4Q2D384_9AGAR|nr:hypothetical protein EST38_g13041 [Candolleomyces aberdarensis]